MEKTLQSDTKGQHRADKIFGTHCVFIPFIKIHILIILGPQFVITEIIFYSLLVFKNVLSVIWRTSFITHAFIFLFTNLFLYLTGMSEIYLFILKKIFISYRRQIFKIQGVVSRILMFIL